MADFHFKAGGAWKTLATNGAKCKAGGVWQQVQTVYSKVGGVWQTIWEAIDYTLSLSNPLQSINNRPTLGPGYAGVRATSGGDLERPNNIATVYTALTDEWIHESAKPVVVGADYEAKMSSLNTASIGSGSIDINFPDNTGWHNLATNRELRLTRSDVGTSIVTGTLEIREVANTSNTTGPVSVTLQITVESGG
jgi:hypothetical protein